MKLNWLAVLAGGSVFFLLTFLTRALGLLVVGDAGEIALPGSGSPVTRTAPNSAAIAAAKASA